MEEYYKYLHEKPELSGVEYNTNLYVKQVLKQYNVEIIEHELSVIAYFNKGKDETLALRSELDALPITECSSHEIRSENDFMHACGHDVHTSCLLHLAKYINDNDFIYNIALVFQSKEESGLGAKSIVETTIFQQLNITKIIAMHVWPNLEDGVVFSAQNLMFGSYELDVLITGESNHISSYDKLTDATFASYKLYKKLYKNTSRYISHLGCISSGTLRNVSSSKSLLKYSIRFKKNNNIESKIKASKIKTKCLIKYDFLNYFPPLVNDVSMLNSVDFVKIKTLKSAEDFGYYSTKCKTLYLLYGLGKGKSLHNEKFIVTKKQRIGYCNAMLLILKKYN